MMYSTEKQRKNARKRHLIAISLIISLIVVLLSQTVFAQNSYVITDGNHVTVHQSYSTDPDEVLQEAGITLNKEDFYTTTYTDGVGNITIRRIQLVTIDNRGRQISIGTYGETVGELLKRLGIELTAADTVSYREDSPTFHGMLIEIVRREVEIYEYDSIVPFETNYFEDADLKPGEEVVLVEGINGVIHYEVQITRENSKEVSRDILNQSVREANVNALIIRGPKIGIAAQPDEFEYLVGENDAPKYTITDNVITTSNGTDYIFTKKVQVSATAYSCEGRTGICYSGTLARVGAVAVDPKVIPLGTKMYIVSNDGKYVYGYCIAEDIGGGIKGARVDLYFDTIAECYQFGVRNCTAYILDQNS